MLENLINTPSGYKWQRLGIRRRAGILVPLFSVYSKNSIGIGDLEDLRLLIDWAEKIGCSIIQLLPMNELGINFCPYDAISSFALEPAYISLQSLFEAKDKSVQEKIARLKKRFPCGSRYVNYGIKSEKINLLWEIYLREDSLSEAKLNQFKEENAYWLLDFALFKALKEYHQGKPWYEWEDKYKNRDKQALKDFGIEHKTEIDFQVWLQWLLFRQFRDIATYARTKRVLLKGDLPILVSRDSADVWQHPEFFKLDYAAGAPPDVYCAKGQRWGMPTYNWQNIADDCYTYLKEKLHCAENFYDMLRIDHVVGLFRIWSIPYSEPLENRGLNGEFDPKDEAKWEAHGKETLLVILNNTKMLICAEDLGVVPQSCTKTLREFGIPGNDVQRWVKDWNIRHDFLEPKDFRLLSVAMLSTHDTPNWPAWWENEAGTIDEGLFIRKCESRHIDYQHVKGKLFDLNSSKHGRLRWQESVDSVAKLLSVLGKKQEEVRDLIGFYNNSYREKEKLWKHLGLNGPVRQKCDKAVIAVALKITLGSRSIFCIESIIDWLYLADIFKGEPYQYRINTPGTVTKENWSLVIPVALDELLRHKVSRQIEAMISASARKV